MAFLHLLLVLVLTLLGIERSLQDVSTCKNESPVVPSLIRASNVFGENGDIERRQPLDSVSMRNTSPCFLRWEKGSGSLQIYFETTLNIVRIRVWYDTSHGLPQINVSSFCTINSPTDEVQNGINCTGNFMANAATPMNMTFDLNNNIVEHFCLRGVEFYACDTATVTSDSPTPNPPSNNTSLVIIVCAAVLGVLLLLVMFTVIGLICAVLYKRKPSPVYQAQLSRENRRNTYEAAARQLPKYCDDFSKETVESINPQPPTDPEYATIAEWRRDNPFPHQPSVVNTFYASSMTSLANRSSTPDPPNYMEVVDSSFNHQAPRPEKESVQNVNLNHTYSLQDVRGKEPHTQQQKLAGQIPAARRAQTLTGGYNSQSTHNLPSRVTVKRHASMKSALNNTTKPVPPPRPMLKPSVRSLCNMEPHLQPGSQASPLVQSLRAPGGLPDESARRRGQPERRNDSSDEDVGNDNYIILPGSKAKLGGAVKASPQQTAAKLRQPFEALPPQ